MIRASRVSGASPCWKWLRRVAEFESELVLHRGAQDTAQAASNHRGRWRRCRYGGWHRRGSEVGAAVVGGLPGGGVAEDV